MGAPFNTVNTHITDTINNFKMNLSNHKNIIVSCHIVDMTFCHIPGFPKNNQNVLRVYYMQNVLRQYARNISFTSVLHVKTSFGDIFRKFPKFENL